MSDTKREIFEKTLSNPFEHKQYVNFLKELLDNLQIITPDEEKKVYDSFSAAIDHYRHIGNYEGNDKNKVALFTVCLKNDKNQLKDVYYEIKESELEEVKNQNLLDAFNAKYKHDANPILY